MADVFTPEKRSEVMSRIRSRDTKPELAVRSLAHRMGFRFRLHRKDLAGRPDLAFISRGKAIFVHGCFWHHHKGWKAGRFPKSNTDYWRQKLMRNMERDTKAQVGLASAGWQVMVIWECELQDLEEMRVRLLSFLGETAT